MRRGLSNGTDTLGLGLAFVQHFDGERKRGAAVRLLRLELPYGGVIHFEGETGAEIDVSVRMN